MYSHAINVNASKYKHLDAVSQEGMPQKAEPQRHTVVIACVCVCVCCFYVMAEN